MVNSMGRFYLRLILLSVVVFSATILLIRSQPYDDHELREFLLPEGCPAPCFMGIRPGVTTPDEAMKLLEANKWIAKIDKESNKYSDRITWTWNNRIPKWINPTSEGQIVTAYTRERSFVHTIRVSSFLQLGAVYGVLGWPDEEYFSFGEYSIGEVYGYNNYIALYNQVKLYLFFAQDCRTGYPGTVNGESPGVPFTALVHFQMGSQFSSPAPAQPIRSHSIVHFRRACGS